MPEPAFDTLDAARRLKAAGIDSEHAEAIVEVMGQSVKQLVTREHFDAGIANLKMELHARVGGVEANVQSLESKVQSLEATVRTEIMRAVLIVVGVLIPAIGLMMAIAEFYSARVGGA